MYITNNNINIKYSLKKYPTNSPPEYSVLYLDTSSDSPSTKSTGVRPTSQLSTKMTLGNKNNIGVHTNKNNNTKSYLHESTIIRYLLILE